MGNRIIVNSYGINLNGAGALSGPLIHALADCGSAGQYSTGAGEEKACVLNGVININERKTYKYEKD